MFLFGLSVWFHVAAVQMIYPTWMGVPFSHVNIPLFNWRVDEAGMVAFAASAFGFCFWQLEKESRANSALHGYTLEHCDNEKVCRVSKRHQMSQYDDYAEPNY
jgi:hypothetical protein